ncbi:uncharacterized protein LOC120732849 [Simochromis diagramma]|uniref:uncharacterized protein LOC120732849 n=1 Tax=Simochromis diagramma TaxID=43689 RepID=UPI001A7E3C92|nr:uncharacterized protein LOC120732849 [Simochromis diagramma]
MTTKKLLIETLNQLSPEDFAEFRSLIEVEKNLSSKPWDRFKKAETQHVVELMEETYRGESVEETRRALMKMNRTDLVQRLSDKQFLPLSQRVEMMELFIELLLETLADLRGSERKDFIKILKKKYFLLIPLSLFEMSDVQDVVFLMVQTYGRQSVEKIVEVLKEMKRTDLAQRLKDSSSEAQHKHLDEHLVALIDKVATMAAVKDLLVETLEDLSEQDLVKFKTFLQFTRFQKSLPQIELTDDRREIVNDMIDKLGQQSVEVIREVLTDTKRIDLVQRLSESSSRLKEKHSEDERWPALIHRVETMESVIELLLETLYGLNNGELVEFNKNLLQIHHDKYYSDFSWMPYEWTDLQDTVFLMVQTYGQQSVEKTMEVLKEMKRTDLAQRLSDCSSLPRKKRSVDERRSALIHKVATMAAVKHLYLEYLNNLNNDELQDFQRFLQSIFHLRNLLYSSTWLNKLSTRADIVNLVMDELGQQSVEVITYMNRTNLVQKLPESISASREKHSVDEHGAALLKREKELEAVRQILLETLNEFSQKDLGKFILLLPFTCFKMGLPQIQIYPNRTEDLMNLMVGELGHQSVEVTMEVLTDMNSLDLMLRLSESSSEKCQPSLFHTEASMTSVKEKLLETPENFSFSELEHFKRVLQQRVTKRGFQRIPASQLETADRADVVQLIVETCGEEPVEVTMEVLADMNTTDLVLRLSESSSGRKTERSSELEGCQSMTQDPSDWTKLEPEVNSTDADEAPTYSLQSAAGHFECRVSGLRWVCKGKTSFQYQFRSWEGHMERMESRQYMPAGPLMDVTVTAGKLNEVHLPHWICIDDIPDILDTFAVVHIDDCGDVVEKVSEVTPSHVKLTEPHFSIIGALIRSFFPLKISCYTLMYYKPNTSFLKLHVYPIRQDPALEQRFDDRESCEGFKRIRKHHPDKYLQTERTFSLRADNASAKIQPKELTLRYNRQNFYEVYVKNPGSELILTLLHTEPLVGEPDDPLWTCEIRKEDDHPESGYVKEKYYVDEDLAAQMQKALTVQSDREKLVGMLKDLKKEELEKFKWFLRDRDVLVELQPIPESRLEKTSTCNLVELMLQTYTEKSVEVTKKVLKKITSSLQKENHFVDKHRVELIQRVSNIAPILDELLKEKVIQQESYDRIRALQTSQEKMRELYSGPLKAGSASKDVFYQILQTHEKLLLNDLC